MVVAWPATAALVAAKAFWAKRRRPMKTMHLNKYVSMRLSARLPHAHLEKQKARKKKKDFDVFFFFFFFFFRPPGQVGRWLDHADDCGRNETSRSRASRCAVFLPQQAIGTCRLGGPCGEKGRGNEQFAGAGRRWHGQHRRASLCRRFSQRKRQATDCVRPAPSVFIHSLKYQPVIVREFMSKPLANSARLPRSAVSRRIAFC
jgi:hypothetical protein